jgi:hypothetical protein
VVKALSAQQTIFPRLRHIGANLEDGVNSTIPDTHRSFLTVRFANPSATLAAVIGTLLVTLSARGADPEFKVLAPRPGGLSASPDITSVAVSNLQLILTWQGFAGPYQIEGQPALGLGNWQPIGSATSGKTAILTNAGGIQFFRINGKPPPFTGVEGGTCVDCHSTTHTDWSLTAHANAFATLKAVGQDNNPACVACHTVGFGYPSGFSNELATPLLCQCSMRELSWSRDRSRGLGHGSPVSAQSRTGDHPLSHVMRRLSQRFPPPDLR